MRLPSPVFVFHQGADLCYCHFARTTEGLAGFAYINRTITNQPKERHTTMKATWNGATLAENDETVVVEGNHYFPVASLNLAYFRKNGTHTTCPWKGEASYYDISVDGKENKDAAWFYPQPKEAASSIKDRVAFWKGVVVE
jgi:uncharacterized protein (DUF427 family)